MIPSIFDHTVRNSSTIKSNYQPCSAESGKLGEYSDKSGSMIGNLAEYSDKTENDVADAASRAG